jgi:hypothetical protein
MKKEKLFPVYQFEKPALFTATGFVLIKKGQFPILKYIIPFIP